jgi:hypothetical protein
MGTYGNGSYQQLNYGNAAVNGNLIPNLTPGEFFPSQAYVPYYAGAGAPTPTLPPTVTLGGPSSGMVTSSPNVSNAASVPWYVVLAALLIGVLGIRHFSYRES